MTSVRPARPGAGIDSVADECVAPSPNTDVVVPPDDETLAAMAKAVAHPARLEILRLLADRTTCVTGDVVAELPLAQSTVSEHLRILREAGLIQGEIEGPRTRYCVNATGLAILKAGIAAL
jgi:ArsR family transcriptional regulator, arsenate/arsenite/antimonite-responsive transcriptional repressor